MSWLVRPVREMLSDNGAAALRYQMSEAGVRLETLYARDELMPASPREDRAVISIEPPAADALSC